MIVANLFAILALTVSLPFVPDATALGAGTRIIGATLGLAVLPGAVVLLLWRPRETIGLLEFTAISIALSFGIMHLVTVATIVTHTGVPVMSIVVLTAIAVGLLLLLFKRSPTKVHVGAADVVGLLALLAVAACLYVQGSPVADWEDQVHVAIVRRLAALDRLTLDNFYLIPNVIYTYPFPSTHAFMAFVAHLGRVDALFVYHKIRFFWGPAAILMIYLGALAVFGTQTLAFAALLTAAVLTLTGVFAVVEGSYWGQLATFSHASDVSMALLLPALLALTYGFLTTEVKRERALLFFGAVMLAFALTVVHVREIVQYLAYVACFVLVTMCCAPFRPMARRGAVLLATTLVIAAVFVSWHERVVLHVADLVATQRNHLVEIARSTSAHDLLLAPAARLLPSFVLWFDAPFHGLTPLLIFCGPVAIVAYRQRPLVWLIAASSVGYLLVMNIPALAIPYIYLTYSEILITPIRNLTPFLHMVAGPVLLTTAMWLWTVVRPRSLAVIAIAACGVAIGLVGSLAAVAVNQSELRFFAPAILAWAATLLYVARRGPLARLTPARVTVLVLLAVMSAAALWPDGTPRKVPPVLVNVRWGENVNDAERVELERRFSLVEVQRTDAADTRVYDMTDTSHDNVKALVTDSAVRDTFHINRTTFDVDGASARPWLYPSRLLVIVTAMGLWICGFVLPSRIGSAAARVAGELSTMSLSRAFVPFALLAIPVFALTFSPTLSPMLPGVVKPFNAVVATPAALLPHIECTERYNVAPPLADTHSESPPLLNEVVSCPPNQRVAEWVRTRVPLNAVLAIDRWNAFMPSVFLPQQVVAFSGFDFSLPNENEIYPTYLRWYRRTMQHRGVQPFFNDRDTPEERRAFVRDLGVTHVLVDPQYYATLHPVLDALPQLFTRRYDDGQWAVYEVIPMS